MVSIIVYIASAIGFLLIGILIGDMGVKTLESIAFGIKQRIVELKVIKKLKKKRKTVR